MGKLLEGFAFERGENQDGDLIAGFGFVGRQLSGKRLHRRGRQDMGEIADTSAECRHVERRGGCGCGDG